jgi:hypothetical protein
MWCTVRFIITVYNVGNVLLCVIYQTLSHLCMLHEYYVIHSVRYYPRFHKTAVGLGTYYPRIRVHYCNWPNNFLFAVMVAFEVFLCVSERRSGETKANFV